MALTHDDAKRARFLNSLRSIARDVEVKDQFCSTPSLYIVSVKIPNDNVTLAGLVRDINPVLERLGYRPIRITRNILNPNAKPFAIDINTPVYLDPGCESYHSM